MIIAPIVEQHAEEAAFLWLLRTGAVRAPHYKLWELAKLDGRVEAHLDGLRVSGSPGWDIVKAQLEEHPESGEAFTATALALEGQGQDRIDALLELATVSEETIRGLISGLGWLPLRQVGRVLVAAQAKKTPLSRRMAMAAWAIHRQNPGDAALQRVLLDPEPAVQARAARAIGELGAGFSVAALQPLLNSKDPACQFWAAWSSALLEGDPGVIGMLLNTVEETSPWSDRALQLAPRRMQVDDANRWLARIEKDSKQRRNAIIAAGVIGESRWIPWLIEQMRAKSMARVAGEAFSMITGVDLAVQALEVRPPAESGAGPTEDPNDDNVAMDADDKLPWPNPDAVAKWWQANGGKFTGGARYLVGKPIEPTWMREVLKNGRQRQRAAAALELAILEPGKPLFEVRAPGFRQ